MPYNTRIVFSAFAVLPAASLNNNDANTDFLKTQVDTTLAQGRLTLESGVAVSTTDQLAKTTLYFTPFRGNRIGLKSGSSWDLYSFTEVSLSLSGYIKGVVYDIFGYLSGGALALESLAWKKVTATNSPTFGAGKVINIADTGELAVGREVTIKDATNSEVTTVTALVANTSITADLVNSYTTPDVYGFNTRATSLTLDDGKWVKSGDATRRYLGSIRITTATGQCEDSESRRFVFNVSNQMSRTFKAVDNTDSWTVGAAWRAMNNNTSYGVGRVGVIVGLAENAIRLLSIATAWYSSSVEAELGIGVDSTTLNSSPVNPGNVYIYSKLTAELNTIPTIGFHYFQRLEGGSLATIYGDNGSANHMGGMTGAILM